MPVNQPNLPRTITKNRFYHLPPATVAGVVCRSREKAGGWPDARSASAADLICLTLFMPPFSLSQVLDGVLKPLQVTFEVVGSSIVL